MSNNSEQKKTNQSFKNKTILLVDDDPNLILLLRDYLEFRDYHVLTAENGREALEILRENIPDVILCDIMMPEMNGYEFVKHIRAETATKTIPVFLLSAKGKIEDRAKGLREGANAYIIKPFEPEKLIDCIEKYSNINPLELANNHIKNLIDINEELVQRNNFLEKNFQSNVQELNFSELICGSIAHDLKNEFLIISTASKNIIELSDKSSEIVEECEMIIRSVKYSQNMLQKLLNSLGLGQMSTQPVDISEILEQIKIVVIPRLPPNIDLEIETNFNIDSKVKASTNFEQLLGVLIELIKNSTNAMSEKGGKIKISVKKGDKKISLAVIDNGSGIPENIRQHLFEKQILSKTSLGLGLFFSKKVIEDLKGELTLQSTSNQGTEIAVSIPVFNENILQTEE